MNSNNDIPVFIPSKGRANTMSTPRVFCVSSSLEIVDWSEVQNLSVFVEPQDYALYAEHYPEKMLVNIGENDKGIAYVRNFILEYAETSKTPHFIMADDDIKGFGKCVAVKPEKTTAQKALQACLGLMTMYNLAAVSTNYRQSVGWNKRTAKDITFGQTPEVCVLFNAEKVKGFRYKSEYDLKEDKEFAYQLNKAGLQTARSMVYYADVPSIGTNKGGLYDRYQRGDDKISAQRLCLDQPDAFQMRNDDCYRKQRGVLR